jgi:hypothetical protein
MAWNGVSFHVSAYWDASALNLVEEVEQALDRANEAQRAVHSNSRELATSGLLVVGESKEVEVA